MVRRKPEAREEAKPIRPERTGPIEPPPTIADLKAIGMTGVQVTCDFCQRSKAMAWDALGLPDEMLFPTIVHRRRFSCSACDRKGVTVVPDWRTYCPQGGG